MDDDLEDYPISYLAYTLCFIAVILAVPLLVAYYMM